MVTHIVIFKLIKNDIKSLEETKSKLLSLKKLSFHIEFNIVDQNNIFKSDLDSDLILFSKFNTEKDLQSYMIDPEHLKVIKDTSKNIRDKYIIDFNSN